MLTEARVWGACEQHGLQSLHESGTRDLLIVGGPMC